MIHVWKIKNIQTEPEGIFSLTYTGKITSVLTHAVAAYNEFTISAELLE
jgi:hypothetical protein